MNKTYIKMIESASKMVVPSLWLLPLTQIIWTQSVLYSSWLRYYVRRKMYTNCFWLCSLIVDC